MIICFSFKRLAYRKSIELPPKLLQRLLVILRRWRLLQLMRVFFSAPGAPAIVFRRSARGRQRRSTVVQQLSEVSSSQQPWKWIRDVCNDPPTCLQCHLQLLLAFVTKTTSYDEWYRFSAFEKDLLLAAELLKVIIPSNEWLNNNVRYDIVNSRCNRLHKKICEITFVIALVNLKVFEFRSIICVSVPISLNFLQRLK